MTHAGSGSPARARRNRSTFDEAHPGADPLPAHVPELGAEEVQQVGLQIVRRERSPRGRPRSRRRGRPNRPGRSPPGPARCRLRSRRRCHPRGASPACSTARSLPPSARMPHAFASRSLSSQTRSVPSTAAKRLLASTGHARFTSSVRPCATGPATPNAAADLGRGCREEGAHHLLQTRVLLARVPVSDMGTRLPRIEQGQPRRGAAHVSREHRHVEPSRASRILR